MPEHPHTTHTKQTNNFIHTDLVKKNWMVQCTDENSYTLHRELHTGGYSQKNWVGVCDPLPKTLTLFMTKICDFPYPIYGLIKNLIPFLWPDF